MSACGLTSIPSGRAEHSLVLQCAHDVIGIDPSTNKKMAPHFVINCTDLCKQLGDMAAKMEFGDEGEQQLYEVILSNTKLPPKSKIKNLNQALSKAQKTVKAKEDTVKKAKESGAEGRVIETMQNKAAGARRGLERAREALQRVQDAMAKAKDAEKKVAKAVLKQKLIIQCWSTTMEQHYSSGAVDPQRYFCAHLRCQNN